MKSLFGTLNWADIGKGFLIAFLTSAFTGLMGFFQFAKIPQIEDIRDLALVGLSAGIAYLLKNVFTNSQNQLFKGEPKI